MGNGSSLVGNSPTERFGAFPSSKLEGFWLISAQMNPAAGEALQPETPMGAGKPGTGCGGLSPWEGKSLGTSFC